MGTAGFGDSGTWACTPMGGWLLLSASAGDLVLGSAGLMSRSGEMQDGEASQRRHGTGGVRDNPPAKVLTPILCRHWRPQGWGYSILQLQEEKPRHGAMPGLVSSRGSALGRLEILPGTGTGSALRLVWGGMWPVGQSLRGVKRGPGPQGVSCSVSRFLPSPSAGAGVSAGAGILVSAGNQTGGQEGPGTGDARCRPRPPAPCSHGCSGVQSAVLHQPSAEGKLRHGA